MQSTKLRLIKTDAMPLQPLLLNAVTVKVVGSVMIEETVIASVSLTRFAGSQCMLFKV